MPRTNPSMSFLAFVFAAFMLLIISLAFATVYYADQTIKKPNDVQKADCKIQIIDNHEYLMLIGSSGICHKADCKYCAETLSLKGEGIGDNK